MGVRFSGSAIVILGLAGPAVAAPPGDVFAVYDVEPRPADLLLPAVVLSASKLLHAKFAEAGYVVTARAELEKAIRDKKAESYANCYDEACQIEIGKELAANRIVAATFGPIPGGCELLVTVTDIARATTDFSAAHKGTCDEAGLRAAIDGLAVDLRARRSRSSVGRFTLDLKAGQEIVNPPTDEKGYLRIQVEAQDRPDRDVEIYINGRREGAVRDRRLFQRELPVGRYVVLLRATRYQHRRFDFQLTPEGARIPAGQGALALEPEFGTLILEGTPAIATAIIDGQPRAISGALREEVDLGTHRVTVEASGYLPADLGAFEMRPGGEVRLTYRLERDAGRVELTGEPLGARVHLDGEDVGALPLELPLVDAGDHLLEVRAPGHHDKKLVVKVQRGATARESVTLTRKLARLKVEAVARVMGDETPVEAQVLVDGVERGTTPWKGELTAELPHRIQLRLGRALGPEQTVVLAEGREQLEVVEVPPEWGGSVATLVLDLVPGPQRKRCHPILGGGGTAWVASSTLPRNRCHPILR